MTSAPTSSIYPAEAQRLRKELNASESDNEPLASVHTTSFRQLLEQLRASLLVTTYQAGRLIVLRAADGVLNTHFRSFARPMGLALSANRLAIGTAREIHEFQNIPAVAARLDTAARHDACFVPRMRHVTGDVQIHEMAYGGDHLWFVNTAFSAICTRSNTCSFEPQWRPAFVSQLSPEDRCHLNGMALVDGRPHFATALGETDTAGGWRVNKRSGGVLLDIASNQVICRGLSMPHSPRWHNGQLWLLNSGTGGIGTVDLATHTYHELAQLPGFTRGLAFCGPWAFVGLSQVRESAVFSGISVVEKSQERVCGVWVLDTRTGQTAGFVKFSGDVQEIFSVEVLAGLRFPEVLEEDHPLLDTSFVLPDAALADVPLTLQQPN